MTILSYQSNMDNSVRDRAQLLSNNSVIIKVQIMKKYSTYFR